MLDGDTDPTNATGYAITPTTSCPTPTCSTPHCCRAISGGSDCCQPALDRCGRDTTATGGVRGSCCPHPAATTATRPALRGEPLVVTASATTRFPAESAGRLCGRDMTPITHDYSAHGVRTIVLAQPAVDSGSRPPPSPRTYSPTSWPRVCMHWRSCRPDEALVCRPARSGKPWNGAADQPRRVTGAGLPGGVPARRTS